MIQGCANRFLQMGKTLLLPAPIFFGVKRVKFSSVMTKKTFLLYTANAAMFLALPLFLMTAGINLAVNTPFLYSYGFEQYSVAETTGISDAELKKAALELREYFASSEELPSITVEKEGADFELFNEKEKIHLKDVKDLFKLNYLVFMLSFILIAVYGLSALLMKDKGIAALFKKGMFFASGFTLAAIIIVMILALLDFNGFFYRFHELAFTNDFWLLNPNTDYLIMMFPQGFWYDSAITIGGFVTGGALIIGTVSYLAMRGK